MQINFNANNGTQVVAGNSYSSNEEVFLTLEQQFDAALQAAENDPENDQLAENVRDLGAQLQAQLKVLQSSSDVDDKAMAAAFEALTKGSLDQFLTDCTTDAKNGYGPQNPDDQDVKNDLENFANPGSGHMTYEFDVLPGLNEFNTTYPFTPSSSY